MAYSACHLCRNDTPTAFEHPFERLPIKQIACCKSLQHNNLQTLVCEWCASSNWCMVARPDLTRAWSQELLHVCACGRARVAWGKTRCRGRAIPVRKCSTNFRRSACPQRVHVRRMCTLLDKS